MNDITSKFGEYAGKVWEKLNENSPLTEKQLIEKTGLKRNDVYSAIGWLAKENKILKENMRYQLGKTNLTSDIGTDAGMVWKILNMWGEVDITSITRLGHMSKEKVFSAVGWLAREDKIGAMNIEKKKKIVTFQLK
jgi:hypothetical protein